MTQHTEPEAPHLWRLVGVSFQHDGAHTRYECDLCEDTLDVPPDGVHPQEC